MAIPLVIDNQVLANLRAFAENNLIYMTDLIDIAEGRATPPGDREGYMVELPVDFRVVFSIEEHPQKNGEGTRWLKHMSMSLAVPGRLPSVPAVTLVCEALGFPPLEECLVNVETKFDGQVPPHIEVLCFHE